MREPIFKGVSQLINPEAENDFNKIYEEVSDENIMI
jgi:hypothetical protein